MKRNRKRKPAMRPTEVHQQAESESEAKKSALKFMERFIDDDDNPERIENGYTFYNNEIIVRLDSIKETTKEKFKDFLLKLHTIDMT